MEKDRAVLDVLFPVVRATVIRLLFEPPQRHRYVRELRDASGLAMHTVQDELRKLLAIGVITSWSDGYHRFYVANSRHPLFKHLVALVQVSSKLPDSTNSTLRRPAGRKRRKPKRPELRTQPDRPLNWGIFSKR